MLAVVLPAAFTFGAGFLITRSDSAEVAKPRQAGELAALAEAPLRPLAPTRGVAALGALPLENVDGGIRPAPPARISIPEARIDADVRAVRAPRGVLAVPPVGVAGWYSGGPRPGEYGRSVVIGHLDTKRGPGLVAEVPKLRPGAAISVIDQRGELHGFRVVGTAQVHKDRFPAEQVYGAASAPVLVLVTCGGEWLGKERGYRDNILLYARAVAAEPARGGSVRRKDGSLMPLPDLARG